MNLLPTIECRTCRLDPERFGLHAAEREEPAACRRRDVAFQSGGVTCRAWLFEPGDDAARPAPCIVMAHGLGGNRECALEPYAKRFAAAGFYVLLFDYRHIGASDGDPRQLVQIGQQLEDWASAIEFARGLAGVDPARIGLWGTSLSGGHVLTTAARNPHVAAISAQCPMLDGTASSRMLRRRAGVGMIARILCAAVLDKVRSLIGLSPNYVPLVAPAGHVAAMQGSEACEGMQALVPRGWRNQVAARLFLSMPYYRPIRHARAVKCPTLIIACGKDNLVSSQAAVTAAERMGEKAKLITLPIGHFEIYLGEWFERSSNEQVAFFKEALRARQKLPT
jgi:dienelactone hydrolase